MVSKHMDRPCTRAVALVQRHSGRRRTGSSSLPAEKAADGKQRRQRAVLGAVFGGNRSDGYMQFRGSPALGLPFYASYLLPFTFLVIGTSFWPAAERSAGRSMCGLLHSRRYIRSCVVPTMPGTSCRPGRPPIGRSFWWEAACWPQAWCCASERRVFYWPSPVRHFHFVCVVPYANGPHAYRRQYEVLMHARERIETIRNGHPFRFWFDDHDPGAMDYYALGSTYLWSSVGNRFPELSCDVDVLPGTVLSSFPPAATRLRIGS